MCLQTLHVYDKVRKFLFLVIYINCKTSRKTFQGYLIYTLCVLATISTYSEIIITINTYSEIIITINTYSEIIIRINTYSEIIIQHTLGIMKPLAIYRGKHTDFG